MNRAVVVLAVASWQAVIQDYVHAVLDLSRPSAGSIAITSATYSVIAGRAQTEVQAFATPNAQNCRRLLQGVGFDPRPHWTWRQRGGRGVGMVTVTPHDADTRIDEWLKVRTTRSRTDTMSFRLFKPCKPYASRPVLGQAIQRFA